MNKIQIEEFFDADKERPLSLVYLQCKNQPNEREIMTKYCLETNEPANQRVALEYLYSNGLFQQLGILIEKNRQSDNKDNQMWGKMYQILCERKKIATKQLKPSTPWKHLNAIERLKIEDDNYPILLLKSLIYIYTFFDSNQYGKIGTYKARINGYLSEIRDPLLHELFRMRINEILLVYHWKRNELILSRKYGYELLNTLSNKRKIIDVHNILAQGYLFESYEQSYSHVTSALAIAESIQYERAIYGISNYTLPFISSYHGETQGITTEDYAEKAHVALANGDRNTCIRLLEKIEDKTPFQDYYLGKAKRDKDLLVNSYRRFIEERDDYFYARLPLEALKELDI
ncbi:hypothetical protein GGQ92_001863 [Gracilibacillus halotolerans]|uniref:Uncharacterized protein n=1 Tax=Gracilibacillus halotolerans TaxID=74386 RepID=A0A841RN75_9BACI|nr:AimR family lysis-lysogeny pheromone receptor [Gracilibacillus halotolerans]MBB6513073.1 hypothetical protein [Gracilibacillus halotolerans]